GTYVVSEVVQTDWMRTTPLQTIIVDTGDVITADPIGNFHLATLDGIKFNDLNGNGVRDANEPVLPGWMVYLDTGVFGPPATYPLNVNYQPPLTLQSVAVADFNADGKLDIAATDWLSHSLSVLAGNGDGTFAAAVVYSVCSEPDGIVAGDFNEDGHLDLVVGSSGGADEGKI